LIAVHTSYKAFLGTTFNSWVCLDPKFAVPYISAFRLLSAYLRFHSTAKFKLRLLFGDENDFTSKYFI
jgi:hypothetical protein